MIKYNKYNDQRGNFRNSVRIMQFCITNPILTLKTHFLLVLSIRARTVRIEMPLKMSLSPIGAPVGPGIHRLTRKPSSEEHVEYLLGRHVCLEAVRRVVVVKSASVAVTVAGCGAFRTVKVVLATFFRV